MADTTKTFEIEKIESNDECSDQLSAWQIAKRISCEFSHVHSKYQSLADYGHIEAWLESEL